MTALAPLGYGSSGRGEPAQLRLLPLADRLKYRKDVLETELAEVNAALAALAKHSDVAETIDAISRLGL